jgi:hypothetical protein
MNLEQYQPLAMRTAKRMEPMQMLLHGAMGCGSEAGELAETTLKFALKGIFDRTNTVEEIGDGVWFVTYIAETLGMQIADTARGLKAPPLVRELRVPASAHEAVAATLTYNATGAQILTIIKAHVFYGKALDLMALEQALRGYVAAIYFCCEAFNVNITEVLEHNIAKLRKRYAEKYSDVAAITRADKIDDNSPSELDIDPATHPSYNVHNHALADGGAGPTGTYVGLTEATSKEADERLFAAGRALYDAERAAEDTMARNQGRAE